MRILVIGLGSMGKRRIRLLKEHTSLEIYGVDSKVERCEEVKELFGVDCYLDLEEAVRDRKMDCAFVCTSPLSHASIIGSCLEKGLHVFTEINLVSDGYEENMRLAAKKGLVLFLSSTFLYRKETRSIIDRVQGKTDLNYIYHVGQYLPDWHPWESYKNYFIGHPRTNGCREIMAIDLPWLVTAFGEIGNIQFIKGRNSKLNISYDDHYLMLLEHKGGVQGVFVVDVVSRKPFRHIDVWGEYLQLSWNGTPDSLLEFDIAGGREVPICLDDASEHVEGYASFITENPYREEIRAFLNQVANPSVRPAWDFVRDLKLLCVLDRIGV